MPVRTAFRLSLLLLTTICTVCYHSAIAADNKIVPLQEVLQSCDDYRQLELKFANGQSAQGYLVAVTGDTLRLRQNERSGPVETFALSDVIMVREWRSNAATGARVGAASGGVIAGGFGLLLGAYVASINNHESSDVAPYVVGP